MRKTGYKIKSKVFLYPGMTGWHFLSVPKKETAEIRLAYAGKAKGWGSLPVEARVLRTGSGQVGNISWKSSISPESKSGTYLLLLLLKAAIRRAGDIFADDTVTFSIKIKV